MSTKLKVILDRSGSMMSVAEQTVDRFNEYINKLVVDRGKEKIIVSLYQFDDEYDIVYEDVKVQDVKPLVNGVTYIPRGSTALLDAIGKTMSAEGADLKKNQKGICVIITDGYENASSEYNNKGIEALIKDLEDDSAWTFVYLGADQDAFSVARHFGFRDASKVMSYGNNEAGVAASFDSLAVATAGYSSLRSAKGMSVGNQFFSKDQLKEAEDTKKKTWAPKDAA